MQTSCIRQEELLAMARNTKMIFDTALKQYEEGNTNRGTGRKFNVDEKSD